MKSDLSGSAFVYIRPVLALFVGLLRSTTARIKSSKVGCNT